MSVIQLAAYAICIALGLGAVIHGPRMVALGIVAILCHVTGQQARNALEELIAPREAATDRWGPTSKADRRLLDRSLRVAMRRMELQSLAPDAFR